MLSVKKIAVLLFILLIAQSPGIIRANMDYDDDDYEHEVRPEDASPIAKATFAGGCFWCMQHPFDQQKGVIATRVGYTGGNVEFPTYEQVTSGKTGHAEAIEIDFDADSVNYEQLLDIFWRNVDPTAKDRQFADVGSQYRTVIFFHSEDQERMAIASKEKLANSRIFRKPIVTEIAPAGEFYVAEDYHQKYYKKNPGRYRFYKVGSGRENYLKKKWGHETLEGS